MTVAGAVVPDAVAVSHVALGVTVNGTILPAPIALTLTVCEATPCVPFVCPVKVSSVGETFRTGFVVTTSVTGIGVTLPPETSTVTVVVYVPTERVDGFAVKVIVVPLLPEPPLAPEAPVVPLLPDVPLLPELPDDPEVPLVPDVPLVPEAPLVPEVPDVPEVPELPLLPELPEVPEVPEDPLELEAPSVPLIGDTVSHGAAGLSVTVNVCPLFPESVRVCVNWFDAGTDPT